MPPRRVALQGVCVLAVEDDYLVMLELATTLHDAGATMRSCGTVAQALSTVARKLAALGTPFVFYTGQVASDPTMAQWPRARVISKPAPPSFLIRALVEALRSSAESR